MLLPQEVRRRCTEMFTSVHIQGAGKLKQAADKAESVAYNQECRLFLRDLNSGTNFLVETSISALPSKGQTTLESDLRRARLIDEETGLATQGKSVHAATPTINIIPGHGPFDHILREFPTVTRPPAIMDRVDTEISYVRDAVSVGQGAVVELTVVAARSDATIWFGDDVERRSPSLELHKNAPTTFQRLVDEFLEGLNKDAIQVYKDDIIVFSRSEQEHGRRLRQLLHKLKEFGLKASCEKSSFFNARFLPSLADRMDGWNSLKRAKFVITENMREALESAKARLCEDPVLRFPNFSLPFVITTDASQVAVGTVLSQVDSGRDRPVAYANKKLTPAESRYSAIKRELLGVEWAVEHFRPYVWGWQFQI
ncbi:hypothetical protein AAG570_013051 [Ranatra chinensis]|uniref:Reverse transcriptase/retrotransposon-derived protein RNase H-like domain-containing protein n=1 Tax=Ranatra chinensis TaxID=642074 RepID=A0ABD0YFR9_9HEMI